LFETAAADGLDIGFDLYPYEASASDLMQYLPQWAQAGGSVGVAANNGDPVWRRRVLDDVQKGWFGGIPWLWDRVVITAAGPHVQEVGLSIEAISQLRGTPPEQVLLDLCAELGSAARAVLHYRQDSDVTEFLGHPLAVIGSDGNAVSLEQNVGKPHPRGFGTFPRVLGRYVRQRGALTLANAVHKMTLAPAERLGLGRRGALRTGYWADVVVFNPETVIDRATFIEPRQPPVGIVYVFVNGSMVVNDGQLVPTGQGRVLRHG
jgi:N-acyl-D-aspartate/D-glutamate deacylase